MITYINQVKAWLFHISRNIHVSFKLAKKGIIHHRQVVTLIATWITH